MGSAGRVTFYDKIKRRIFSPITRLLCTYEVLGEENLPEGSKYILAPNHLKWYAPILLQVYLQQEVAFVAKIELFRIPGLQRIMVKAKQIPIDRQKGSSPGVVKELVAQAKSRIKDGMAVGIFPEGTRSPDGRLGEFRRGAIMIAQQSGAPIIPVGLFYFRRRRFSKLIVRIIFGGPLIGGEFSNARELTEELERQVATLSGLESHKDYNGRILA